MGNVIAVLIGAGQFTYRGDPAQSPSPVALLKIAAERAAADGRYNAFNNTHQMFVIFEGY